MNYFILLILIFTNCWAIFGEPCYGGLFVIKQTKIADMGIEPMYHGYESCVEPLQLNLQQ